MKYIRTKDGRVIDTTVCRVCEELVDKPLDPGKGYLVYPHDVIATSDSIDVLCDNFVYLRSDGHRYIEKHLSRNNGIEIISVYGSIWVGENLYAVAKIDQSGELILL